VFASIPLGEHKVRPYEKYPFAVEMESEVAADVTVENKIPLNPPFPKGDFNPPLKKGGRGDFPWLG